MQTATDLLRRVTERRESMHTTHYNIGKVYHGIIYPYHTIILPNNDIVAIQLNTLLFK